MALFEATRTGPLPQATIGLAQLRAAQLLGDPHLPLRSLREAGEHEDRIAATEHWREAACFTPQECTALALTEALITTGKVPDDPEYDDDSLIALITAISQIRFRFPGEGTTRG